MGELENERMREWGNLNNIFIPRLSGRGFFCRKDDNLFLKKFQCIWFHEYLGTDRRSSCSPDPELILQQHP